MCPEDGFSPPKMGIVISDCSPNDPAKAEVLAEEEGNLACVSFRRVLADEALQELNLCGCESHRRGRDQADMDLQTSMSWKRSLTANGSGSCALEKKRCKPVALSWIHANISHAASLMFSSAG